MRLLRGRMDTPAADQRRTWEMVEGVSESGEPALRVWTPHRQVVFGRRDRRSDGYERARAVARQHDYVAMEREVGGRAVAYTGSTVAFSLAEPVEDHRSGIQARYERTLETLQTALSECGVGTERGEPANSFCPGSHSLQTSGGKVVGVAQRVRQDSAVVGGLVVLKDAEAIAGVLDPVYDALGVPFDPASVGCLAAASNAVGPGTVVDGIAGAFTDGRETHSRAVRET